MEQQNEHSKNLKYLTYIALEFMLTRNKHTDFENKQAYLATDQANALTALF
jgi:hypothetical protein